ncbi:MAG: hypothetical protein ACM3UT_06230 [Chloroflexota bacterium]
MKRIITSALLVLLISCASFAKDLVAEGKSPMGNFRIETSDQPVVVNGVELDTYVISYENSDLTVTIAIDKDKKCKRYITMTDNLSVQYVCNGDYFGVEKLKRENSVNGITTSDKAMNRNAYFHQRVLTPGPNDKITCMRLIGAYFPELLKESSGA